ncbi:SecY-interacting protein [Ferrimonas lipolytica]|uniref:SecY-interacting protein n=1 Tax=Ferrimonas lipolytica TaxID=2724191 RepID=A0A6H1UF02_9GAMM|nr:SecY-interacting protein [Ferrimonas lipolytica]QIZ77408.1 SecY-interacting protein [Ferrimonas lipolytica]
MSDTHLAQFIARTEAAWKQSYQHLPLAQHNDEGPALQSVDEQGRGYWLAQPMSGKPLFDNVAAALELELHGDLERFYGQFYAGSLLFDADFGSGELLQIWSDDDLQRLQQNLIGHLLMKQKLKQHPTLFIGLLGQGEQMIVLDNCDGSVWLEVPGELPSKRLADDIDQLMQQLSPRLMIPEAAVAEAAQEEVPQGLWARMAAMLKHLLPKRY